VDSDKRSAQVERLEVVEMGRRRRWSEDEKLKIVLEGSQTPRQVAATARRYGISCSLLLRWRRLFQPAKDATAARARTTSKLQKLLYGRKELRHAVEIRFQLPIDRFTAPIEICGKKEISGECHRTRGEGRATWYSEVFSR
jgi:transposase-like protein